MERAEGALASDSAAVQAALLKIGARTPEVKTAAGAPEDDEMLSAMRDLTSAVQKNEVPAAEPSVDHTPMLETLARSIAELRDLVGKQLSTRDKRIADLEARLSAPPPPPPPPPAPVVRAVETTVHAHGVEELADSMRDLHARMESLRESLKGDLAAAIAGLKHGQFTRPRVEAAELSLSLPVPALGAAPSFDALRQELLGPMAAMKAQLLDLTMSYHQLSLRMAVLASQEKAAGLERME
jgi:hypothetical protein